MLTQPLGRLLQAEDVQSQSNPVRVCGKLLPENVRTEKNPSMHFPFILSFGRVPDHHEKEEQPLVLHGGDLLLPHCHNTRERLRHLFQEASRQPHRFLLCGEGSKCPCTYEASRILNNQNPAASAHQAASDRGH